MYGLGEFHAHINGSHQFTIASECGKPFVTITGIQFASGRPTKAEITAADELLEEFILTHRDTIKKVIIARGKVAKNPPLSDDHLEGTPFTFGRGYLSRIVWKDGPIKWTMDLRTKELVGDTRHEVTPAQLTNYEFDKDLLTQAKAFAKLYNAAKKASDELEEAKKVLTACDI